MASNDVDCEKIEETNTGDSEQTLEYSLESQESKEIEALKNYQDGSDTENNKPRKDLDCEGTNSESQTTGKPKISPLPSPQNKRKMGANQTTMDRFLKKRTPSPSRKKDNDKTQNSDVRKKVEDVASDDTDKMSSGGASPERSASPYQYSSDEHYSGEDWPRPWQSDPDRKLPVKGAEQGKVLRRKRPKLWRKYSDKDTQDYRNGYPGKRDNPNLKKNLQFYRNEISSRPNGDFIDNIHKKWFKDYELLEAHHGYIQWLFPIREHGMNFQAQDLQLHEAEAIMKDEKAKHRLLKSYELMLDFYGMKLKNKETGEIERAENWRSRFRHLNRSMHNYLRITRILKSLGEMGYDHFQGPFVRFVLTEALINQTLDNCIDSCVDYWVHTIKDNDERRALVDFADEHIQEV